MNRSKPRNSTMCSRACLTLFCSSSRMRHLAVPLDAGDRLDRRLFLQTLWSVVITSYPPTALSRT